jgi:hypothetical protein
VLSLFPLPRHRIHVSINSSLTLTLSLSHTRPHLFPLTLPTSFPPFLPPLFFSPHLLSPFLPYKYLVHSSAPINSNTFQNDTLTFFHFNSSAGNTRTWACVEGRESGNRKRRCGRRGGRREGEKNQEEETFVVVYAKEEIRVLYSVIKNIKLNILFHLIIGTQTYHFFV